MSEWQVVKLGELASRITKGTTPTKGQGFAESGVNYIKSDALSYNGKIDISKFVCIDSDTNEKLKRSKLQKDDVLFSMAGVFLGKSGIVTEEMLPANTNQAVAIIRLNQHVANPRFIGQFLRQKAVVEFVNNMSGQSAQPNINFQEIASINVLLPPLSEQETIAAVLSSLDDKIDMLHRQNQTLEAMTETLFRQWFVEEAQADWEEVTLEDVTTRITDGSHASPATVETGLPMASVKDMYQWGIKIDGCRRILPADYDELVKADCRPLKNDILIAKDGSFLKHVFVAECDLDVVVLSSIAILRPNGKYHPLLLATFLKLPSTKIRLENIVTGAVIPRIVLKDFRKFTLLLPNKEQQDVAVLAIQPLYEKCWQNNLQIQTLEKLRDDLLPKLMSGEVRVDY